MRKVIMLVVFVLLAISPTSANAGQEQEAGITEKARPGRA